MRKSRRKIKRRKRSRKRRRRSHLDSAITNRWTKVTTYIMMVFEAIFGIWWFQETVLNWDGLVLKFGNLGNAIGDMFNALIGRF